MTFFPRPIMLVRYAVGGTQVDVRDFDGVCGHCWADYGNSKSWRRVLGRERSNGSAVA